MKVIADLHIHSRYSRATSPGLSIPLLENWARIKGINLLGTGDCTHPLWLEELRRLLAESGDGIYSLRPEARETFARAAPPETPPPRFVLSGEIGTIYKKNGKSRRVHHLVLLPGFEAAEVFAGSLESRGGNIRSDGRPIVGMDSRKLLELLLEADERALLIPAHIWTPWFSALGAASGFDSIGECYGDLTDCIPAIETGLSSNPPMNWALESLDRFSIISNSDAHSAEKLGREATIFDMEFSFPSLRAALFSAANFTGKPPDITGTIEFFPEEGKYHYDGHRKCGVSAGPEKSAAGNRICPVCSKPFTPGVMSRVLELADRPPREAAGGGRNQRPYWSFVPLREIIAEIFGIGPASKKVERAYFRLIEAGGSELAILGEKSREELERLFRPEPGLEIPGETLVEAIMRTRSGAVSIKPGYDGEYGKIKILRENSA